MEMAVESNIQISNISTLKRCNLQCTTWCVVPNEIFGPWMSRRGQGRCSNLVKNTLTQKFYAPFEKFRYTGQARGGYYEKLSKRFSRKLYSLDQYNFKQHYALGLMFSQFPKQQLQSYFFHSRDRHRPLISRCGEIRKKNISKL